MEKSKGRQPLSRPTPDDREASIGLPKEPSPNFVRIKREDSDDRVFGLINMKGRRCENPTAGDGGGRVESSNVTGWTTCGTPLARKEDDGEFQ